MKGFNLWLLLFCLFVCLFGICTDLKAWAGTTCYYVSALTGMKMWWMYFCSEAVCLSWDSKEIRAAGEEGISLDERFVLTHRAGGVQIIFIKEIINFMIKKTKKWVSLSLLCPILLCMWCLAQNSLFKHFNIQFHFMGTLTKKLYM